MSDVFLENCGQNISPQNLWFWKLKLEKVIRKTAELGNDFFMKTNYEQSFKKSADKIF